MRKNIDYNITKYVKSVVGMKKMVLESIVNCFSECRQYKINSEVSEYLNYISEKPFYIGPSFSDVVTDKRVSMRNPKFILFSAPGATGKSSLAKYISYKFNGLYWNLSKIKLGTNSFAGSILSAVGVAQYSQFISDLNTSKALLIIDAFDEAEIISGRNMVSAFLTDIDKSIEPEKCPSIILLARTDTAQYIASFCAENDISLIHYEIGFFLEGQAKDFIRKKLQLEKPNLTSADESCIEAYYDVISKNITDIEKKSFLGYAPVLEAIAEYIKGFPNRSKLMAIIENKTNCVEIVMQIMGDLLEREQNEKVVGAFKTKSQKEHPEFHGHSRKFCVKRNLLQTKNSSNFLIYNVNQRDGFAPDCLLFLKAARYAREA